MRIVPDEIDSILALASIIFLVYDLPYLSGPPRVTSDLGPYYIAPLRVDKGRRISIASFILTDSSLSLAAHLYGII